MEVKIKSELKRVKKICDEYFNLDVGLKTRKREYVKPRQIAHYVCKNNINASLKDIGECIGGVDHATVLHSCKTISNEMYIDSIRRDHFIIDKRVKFKWKKDTVINQLKALSKSNTIDLNLRIELRSIINNLKDEML